MKKILSCLFILMLCTGCSCTPNGSNATPSASPSASSSPSASPSASAETAYTAQDYIDYLAAKFTLVDPKKIDNLDSNAMEGYTFGLNNQSYYLIRLDPTNEQAKNWMSSISSTGQIEVDVDGLPKTMYARLNGNYALISSTNEYMDGFGDYYDQFTGAQALPDTQTSPNPSATPKA